MAFVGMLGLAIICFYFLIGHQAVGRYMPKDEALERDIKKISFPIDVAKTTSKEILFLSRGGYNGKTNLEKSYSMKDLAAINDGNRIHHWAILKVIDAELYGLSAKVSVWEPLLNNSNQASSTAIWVTNVAHNRAKANIIQFGLQVNPKLYGDNHLYFFVFWTADGYQRTGCFDLRCPGFMLHNSSQLVPGKRYMGPISQDGGMKYFVDIKISMDPSTGDWMLHVEDALVGQWPKSLLPGLSNGASQIHIGGIVGFNEGDFSPPMGSGLFPIEGQIRAASFRKIKMISANGEYSTPLDKYHQSYYHDNKTCYTSGPGIDFEGDQVVYFGGPGGCKD